MIAKTTLEALMRDLQARRTRRETLGAVPVTDSATPFSEAIIYIRGARPANTATVASQLEVCREIAARHHLNVIFEIQDNTPGWFEMEEPRWEKAVRLLTDLHVDVLVRANWSSISRHDDDYRTLVELAQRSQFTILTGDDTLTPAQLTSHEQDRA